MQKKIIASLLVSPMAFNAMANIAMDPVNNAAWTATGITGTDIFKDGVVTCPVGTGVISQSYKIAAPGKYNITFANSQNAVFEVFVGGEKVASGESTVSFEVKNQDTKILLKVSAKDPASTFLFGDATVEVVFDFKSEKDALIAALGIAPYPTFSENIPVDEAESLKESYRKLQKEYKTLLAKINAIPDEIGDNDAKLTAYKDYKLYEDPNLIETEILTLLGKFEAEVKKIGEINDTYDTIKANTVARDALLAEVTELRQSLKAVTDQIDADGVSKAVKDKCAEDVKKAEDAIAAYKTAIETAYFDLEQKDIKVESQKATIDQQIADLEAKFNKAVADEAALESLTAKGNELAVAYSQAQMTITGFAGVKDHENVFAAKQAEWMNKISAENEKGKKAAAVTDPAKAAENEETVQAAIDAINAVVEDARELVAAQNAAMEAAQKAIVDVETAFKSQTEEFAKYREWLTIDKEVQEEYDVKVAGINGAIEAAKKTIVDEYGKNDLAEDDYTTKIKEINDLIGVLDDFLAKQNLVNKVEAQKALNDLKEHITETSKDLGVDILGKFNGKNGTIPSIQEAINALTGEYTGSQVETAIKAAKENADKLISAFEGAKVAKDDFFKAIERLNTYVGGKTIVPGSEYDKTNGIDKTLKELEGKRTEWESDYQAAAGMNAQECYDAAVALKSDISAYDWRSKIDSAFNTFENEATKANYQVAVDKLAAVKDNANAPLAAEAFTEIDKTMAEIKTALDAATADNVDFSDEKKVDAKVKACADIDANIVKAIADIDEIADNQKAYSDFKVSLDGVQKEIKELIEFNENTALSPAKEFFAKAINGADNKESLQAQLNDLTETLKGYLANLTVADNNESIKAVIDGLKTKIVNMGKDIKDNEVAHDAQLAKSQLARDLITKNLTTIKDGTNPALVKNWVDDLEALRDDALLTNDRKVTEAYGKGECAKSNDDIIKEYDRIIAEADRLLAEYNNENDGYASKVATHNEEIQATAGWDGTLANLRAEYLSAISAYNAYRGIENPGYKKYLTEKDVFKSHAGIYDYNTAISKLESDVVTAVGMANKEKHALTAGEFDEMATDKAAALLKNMQNDVAAMQKGFNDAGVAYYVLLNGKAEAAIDEAEAKLTAAGLTDQIEGILKEYKDALKKGQNAYAEAMSTKDEGGKGETIGLDMDGIANDLDKVMPIDLQKCAKDKWDVEYTGAESIFTTLETELAGYENASKDVKDAQTERLNKAETDAVTLNGTAGADKTLIDNLADYLTELAGYVTAAQNAVEAVKASNDSNKANEDAYKEYTGTVIPNLNSKLNDLKAFVNALGGTAKVDVDAVEAAVKAVADKVDANRSQLTDKETETEIDKLLKAANTAIDNAYNSAFADEVSYLTNHLLEQAKVSFNNAKAADKDGANKVRLDKINESLDETISKVRELPLAPSEEYTQDELDEFRTLALGYETEICGYIAELQTMYEPYDGETTVDGVLAELDQAVTDVQKKIDEAKVAISGYEQKVQEEFGPQVEALQSELTGIQTEYKAAGSTVIAQQENYEKRIKEVNDKLAGLENDAAAKQVVAKQHAVSDTRYGELETEYDDYVSRLEVLNSLLGEYELDEANFGVSEIQDYLDGALEDLEAKKAEFALDADSKLLNGQNIDYLLDLNTLKAKKRHALDLQDVADDNLTKLGEALAGNIVPDVREEIANGLADLRGSYNTLNGNITDFIPSDYAGEATEEGVAILDGYIQQSETIAAGALALIDKAEEGRYYPGDLNGTDGRVDIGDIQTLISMIGEGVTYEDLYNEDPARACAADVTGDKILTVADVTALIDLALNGNSGRTFAMVRGTVQSESSINAMLVSEANGVRTYAVNLTNYEAFVAGQFDLKVESDAEIVSVYAGDRLASHELSTFDNAGQTRVIIASMENSQISGNEGTTVFVEVKGRSGVGVENVIFADENSQAYALGDKAPETSGIDNIYNSAKAVKEAIYDAAGRAMKSVRRGLNIIRHSDGSVTKEIRK